MKTRVLFFVLGNCFFTIVWSGNRPPSAAISYQRHPGSCGDNFINYCQAKYLAFCHNLPFLYKPFPLSNMFALDSQEQYYNKNTIKAFKKTRCIVREKDVIENPAKPTLYVSDYHVAFDGPVNPDSIIRYRYCLGDTVVEDSSYFIHQTYIENLCFAIIHNDPFRKELVQKITPVIKTIPVDLPPHDHAITVAVHINKGKEELFASHSFYQTFPYTMHKQPGPIMPYYDEDAKTLSLLDQQQRKVLAQELDKKYPLEFPPEQYYVDQILLLSALLHDKPLIVYLFTDYPRPQELLARFRMHVKKSNISLISHADDDHSPVDDLCAMAHFDCLIRGTSNFARTAQLIGNHSMVMYPQHCLWNTNNCLIIDEVVVLVRTENSDTRLIERHVFYQG